MKEVTSDRKEESKREFDPLSFVIGGITDRDAPSLYQANPDRDLFKLWADKVDDEDSSAVDLQEGLLIAHARAKFEEWLCVETDQPSRPIYCFAQNEAMPFLRAIVDAADIQNGFVARIVVFENADEEALTTEPIGSALITRRHWIELQHQMIVLGVMKAYYVTTIDGMQIRVSEVKHDPVFCSNHVAECIKFWDHVRRGVPPEGAIIPPDVDPDSIEAEKPDPAQESLPLEGSPLNEDTSVGDDFS